MSTRLWIMKHMTGKFDFQELFFFKWPKIFLILITLNTCALLKFLENGDKTTTKEAGA